MAGAKRINSPSKSDQGEPDRLTVDASCCLEGNPLVELLHYKALTKDYRTKHNGNHAKHNACLVAFSDNTTGKVFVAVIALRDIAVDEEIAIDYGASSYWSAKRTEDQQLGAAQAEVVDEEEEMLEHQLGALIKSGQQLEEARGKLAEQVRMNGS